MKKSKNEVKTTRSSSSRSNRESRSSEDREVKQALRSALQTMYITSNCD